MYERKMKISGDPQPMKKECQGFIKNLKDKSKIELQDLLERQNKLLSNKSFVLKLPDKGDKIKKFRDLVAKELADCNEIDKAANLLSRLNIATEGKIVMNEIEWTGKVEVENNQDVLILDSDDEEQDPLKIIAETSGAGFQEKKIIHLPPEERLITEEDLKEIESFEADELSSGHIKYLIDKAECSSDKKPGKKEPFRAYQTTKSNVHDPEKEKLRKKNKHWENTAATPPLIVHGAVKELSLNESLKLQIEQTQKIHEIQALHSIERLTQQIGKFNVGNPPRDPGDYREKDDDDSDSEVDEEANQVYDDEDCDKAGTVTFPVDSAFE